MKESVIADGQIPCIILGKEVGTYHGWDQVDDTCICFYKFIPNDLGKKWLGLDSVSDEFDLHFDYNSGVVQTDSPENSDHVIDFICDWSVFNQPTIIEEAALLEKL